MSRAAVETLREKSATGAWGIALSALAVGWLFVLFAYRDTFLSMAAIWKRSETFAHGYLVFPVSLWLAWRARGALRALRPVPSPLAALLLLPAGLFWMVSRLAGINVGEQLALVLMLQLVTLAVLGLRVGRVLWFPLAFLFFAVPMGEALIPPLMEFTARFTVEMIRLTGIPVYAEGTFFSIPGSDWSVVEGCSGIRYLIASVFLGTLYAHLAYRRWWKRLAFVILSVLVPVLANGLRAYLIVMIAHFSDMKLALGVDHFIYGWVFFGFVIFVMFWLGSFWRDPVAVETNAVGKEDAGTPGSSGRHPFHVLALALALVFLPHIWAAWISKAQAGAGAVRADLLLPDRLGTWRRTAGFTDWRPHHLGPTAEAEAAYRRGTERIGIHLAYYAVQKRDAELVNSRNYLVRQKHPRWRNLGERRIRGGMPPAEWVEAVLDSPGQRLLVFRFYWLDGRLTASDTKAKLMEAYDRLRGRFPPAADVILYTDFEEGRREQARARIRRFLDRHWPELEAVLHRAGDGAHG